jgi:hypothetical protein
MLNTPPVKKVSKNFVTLMKKTHPSERQTRNISKQFVNLMIALELAQMKQKHTRR